MTPLARLRRFESAFLIVLVAALALTRIDAATVALALPVLTVAVLLAAGTSVPAQPAVHIKQLLRRLDELEANGLELRRTSAETMAAVPVQGASEILLQNYAIEKWVDRVRFELKPYPEFAGIFEAHGGGDSETQLHGRIKRLREIRRLVALSQKIPLQR